MTVQNKPGRPKTWTSETTHIRIPKEYAQALIEIALEWQQNSVNKNH